MGYNFIEKNLPGWFRQDLVEQVKRQVERGRSFALIGMPTNGETLFLRYLAMQSFAKFIYLDMRSLVTKSKRDFFIALLFELGVTEVPESEQEIMEVCKREVFALSVKHERVVFLFNRFDVLRDVVDAGLVDHLRILCGSGRRNLVMVFSTMKPLEEIMPSVFEAGNLYFLEERLYFPLLSDEELVALVSLYSPEDLQDAARVRWAMGLSGGNMVFQFLLKTAYMDSPFRDLHVQMKLKELYYYLTPLQRRCVEKIATGKKVPQVDEYLLQVEMVRKEGEGFRLFSSLFSEYVQTQAPVRFPVKEKRLFAVLKRSRGKVVSKEELFEVVWGDEVEEATDWALDSLIYRLRKNPGFVAQGYMIESQKKVGYRLIRSMF